MPGTADVPQTIEEAKALGRSWLSVRCLSCRHNGSLHLRDLDGRVAGDRLADLAAKLRCSRCRSNVLEFDLGAYVLSDGQPWARRKRIHFEGSMAVSPARE